MIKGSNVIKYEFAKTEGEDDALDWPEHDKRSGRPLKGSMMNVRYAIDRLGLQCRYEEFAGEYQVDDPLLAETELLGKFVGSLDDMIARKFHEVCFNTLELAPTKEAIFDGLQRACEENRYNTITEYLERVQRKWDGKKRVATWLTDYLGVEDTPLHREWGRIFLSAVVRRPFDPGLKFDHVLVLEGAENAGKSNVFKILASGLPPGKRPKYFNDAPILKCDTREKQELTKGIWIYEIAELAHMQGQDQHLIKAFITAQEDKARAAYAHFRTDQSRIAVFAGTFNTDANTGQLVEYLNPGDRRRWWPVRVADKIDFLALLRDRDQLLGEAMHDKGELFLDGALYQEAVAASKDREVVDVLVDRLAPLFREIVNAMQKPQSERSIAINGIYGTEGDDFQVGDNHLALGLPGERHAWVSSNYVIRVAATSSVKDTRAPKRAMSTLGWRYVFERRPGYPDKVRGYVHALTDEHGLPL